MLTIKKIFTVSVSLAVICNAAAQDITSAKAQPRVAKNETSYTITGKVTDGATGKPIRAVRVSYKTFAANITDSAGNFSIKVPGNTVLLLMEGDGFQSREMAVKGQSHLTVQLLREGAPSSAEIIDLPFNKSTKTVATYATGAANVNDSWSRFLETPDSYLQGKVAGLNVIRRSGTPNIGATMMLRGISSLYGTNQPLIVVDGVLFNNADINGSIIGNHYNNPLSTIDIRDVDNITVLKDATSTYGTKGANGVIYISTIRAKDLATKIDFAAFGGINFAQANLPMMNARDYRIYLSEILKTKGMSDGEIQSQPFMNDDMNSGDYYKYHNETDWQSKVLKASSTKNIYLKVTGGDNIAKYAISLGYMSNGGSIAETDLNKYNMRFNGDLNLSKRMSATTNLSYTFSEQNLRDQGTASKTNPLFLALVKAPFMRTNDVSATGVESPLLADRDTLNIGNPLAIINASQGLSKNYRFLGSIGINYDITDDLVLSSTFAITYDKVRENFFIPRKGVTTDTLTSAIAYSRLGSQVKSFFAVFNDTRLTYIKSFNKISSITTRLGLRYQKERAEQDYGLGYNSAIDDLVGVGNGLNSLRKIGGDIGVNKWMNTYVSADYNYADKYILSFNAAMDGSSRFGNNLGGIYLNNHGYSFMPSLSGAWLISSEKCMKNSRVDLLKLRASIGINGNDDIGNYTAQSTYVSQNLLGMQGLVRGGLGNNLLQWERTEKINVGVDVALLHERLNFSIDAYKNNIGGLIVYQPAPTASGFDYISGNSGTMRTTGIEAALSYLIVNRKAVTWEVGAAIAKSKSVIKYLPAGSIVTMFATAGYLTAEGSVPNQFYGYQANGIYATDADAASLSIKNPNGSLTAFKGGDVRFTDVNGDKIIDEKDKVVLGDPNPDFFGSFYSNASYKRFSLNALFTYSSGNDIYNYTRNQLEGMTGAYNQTNAVLNRWKTNGHQTDIPKATWGDPMGNSRFSNRWIEDGSYIRLRTVTLTYNLPLQSKYFKSLSIYVTGNNLITLTKYKGFDPEFSATESIYGQGVDNTLEPQMRSAQAGFKLGL